MCTPTGTSSQLTDHWMCSTITRTAHAWETQTTTNPSTPHSPRSNSKLLHPLFTSLCNTLQVVLKPSLTLFAGRETRDETGQAGSHCVRWRPTAAKSSRLCFNQNQTFEVHCPFLERGEGSSVAGAGGKWGKRVNSSKILLQFCCHCCLTRSWSLHDFQSQRTKRF